MRHDKHIRYATFEREDESWSDEVRVVPEHVFDEIHISVIDIVRCLTRLNPHESARKTRLMVHDDNLRTTLGSDLKRYKFCGVGQKLAWVVNVSGMMKVMQYMRDRMKSTQQKSVDKVVLRYVDEAMKTVTNYEFEAELDNLNTLVMCKHIAGYAGPPMRRSVESMVKHQLITKFVYACETRAFPGAIKIGRATSVDQRIKSGNSFAAPDPFKVVAVAPSLDYMRDERRALDYFADRKIRGEFFNVTVDEVKKYFQDVIQAKFNRDMESIVRGLATS